MYKLYSLRYITADDYNVLKEYFYGDAIRANGAGDGQKILVGIIIIQNLHIQDINILLLYLINIFLVKLIHIVQVKC